MIEIHLPCGVGDTIYVLKKDGCVPCIVDRINIVAGNVIRVRARYFVKESVYLGTEDFGKTAFLTEKEAIAATQASQ